MDCLYNKVCQGLFHGFGFIRCWLLIIMSSPQIYHPGHSISAYTFRWLLYILDYEPTRFHEGIAAEPKVPQPNFNVSEHTIPLGLHMCVCG